MPAQFDPTNCNARLIQEIFGLSPYVLRSHLTDGLPHIPGSRGQSHRFSAPRVYEWLCERARREAQDTEEEVDGDRELANLRRAQAEHETLKVERLKGELLERSDVVQGWASIVSAARTRLLGVPSRLRAQYPDMPHEVQSALDDLIREALEELSRDG